MPVLISVLYPLIISVADRGGAGRGGPGVRTPPPSPDQGHLWEAPRFEEFFFFWGWEGVGEGEEG